MQGAKSVWIVDLDQLNLFSNTFIRSVLVCSPCIQIIFMTCHSASEICMVISSKIYICQLQLLLYTYNLHLSTKEITFLKFIAAINIFYHHNKKYILSKADFIQTLLVLQSFYHQNAKTPRTIYTRCFHHYPTL